MARRAGYTGRILLELSREPERGRAVFTLLESIRWGSVALKPGDYSDGCSVRWWLSWLVPAISYGTFLCAADHDKLWRARQAAIKAGQRPHLKRAAIDLRFRRLLRRNGVGWGMATVMWLGVRAQAWLSRDLG